MAVMYDMDYCLQSISNFEDSVVDVLIRIHHDNLQCGVNHCSSDYITDRCVLNVAHESLLYSSRKLGSSGHLLHEHRSTTRRPKILCRMD